MRSRTLSLLLILVCGLAPLAHAQINMGFESMWSTPDRPYTVIQAPDGRLFVTMDTGRLYVYSADGALLGTFGAGVGSGPGQWGFASAVAFKPNEVLIADASTNRVLRYA